jgi:hypothetical protein
MVTHTVVVAQPSVVGVRRHLLRRRDQCEREERCCRGTSEPGVANGGDPRRGRA